MSGRLLLSLATAALTLVLGSGARAVTINYSDCTGTTVEYTDISESSAEAPLYNAPTCVGDLLDFNPTGFEANTSSGSNPDFVDGNLLFQVGALDNFLIDNLILDENGDWQVFGFEPSDSLARATLTVRLEILVTPFAGDPFVVEYARQAQLDFTTASTVGIDIWAIHEEFLMAAILADACSGTGYFDPGSGGVGATPGACGATTADVGVNIDNTLLAFAESGELSFINKKDFDGFTITTETEPVPEPATGALVALGLVAISAVRRRV